MMLGISRVWLKSDGCAGPAGYDDGNRAQTRMFLNHFKRFALMNKDATVMKDTLKRCAYFLSLIEGPNVEGWSERAYARLDKIQRGMTLLPPDTTAWDLLEKDFLRSLTDYA